MSVLNWIRSLLPRALATPAAGAAPPPDLAPALAPDPGARIHRAAHDPHFPEKREKAIDAIHQALGAAAAAHGFTAKPRSWLKTGPLGQVSFYMQRSRFGFEASIWLVFHPANLPSGGIWAEEDEVPLAWFYPEAEAGDAGALIYLDVLEQPEKLARAMAILTQRALPWLTAHLSEDQPADLADIGQADTTAP